MHYTNMLFGRLWMILPIFSFCFTSSAQSSKEKFSIVSVKQKLSFEYDEGDVIAKLQVFEIVKCLDNVQEIYKKVLYHDDDSAIRNIKLNGYKVNPIKSTDIPTDEIFHSDTKVAYTEYLFENNKKDLWLEYEKVFYNYRLIDLLKFYDTRYDTKSSIIEIEIPEWLNIDIKTFNMPSDAKKTQVKKGKNVIETFELTNLTKVSDKYNNKPDYRKYTPHLIIIMNEIKKDGVKKELMPNTASQYGWYASMVKEMNNDATALKAVTDKLIAGMTDPIEKMRTIFYFVQDNIKYIAFEHGIMGFKPEDCQTVYQNKYGDCKGMANLAKHMLILAGLDARLTWIGTSDVPYTYALPSVYVDNHMICTVIHDGNYYFIDPTEKQSDLGTYAERIQGREVLIENGKDYIKHVIPVQGKELSYSTSKLKLKIEKDGLIGTGHNEYRGNEKTIIGYYMKNVGNKNIKEFVESFLTGGHDNTIISVSNIPTIERGKNYQIDYNIDIKHQVTTSGNDLYFNLDFIQPMSRIKVEEIQCCGVDFGKKHLSTYEAQLTLPEGYTMTYKPENYIYNGDKGHIEMTIQQVGNTITYKRILELNDSEVLPSQVEQWKPILQSIKNHYSEQIQLSKK